MNNKFFKTLKVINIIILLLALGQWPYDYYTLLRVITFFTGCIGAFQYFDQDKNPHAALFGLIAILFNPLFPIHLDRSTWAIIDVSVAVYMAYSIKADKQD